MLKVAHMFMLPPRMNMPSTNVTFWKNYKRLR